MKLLNIFLVLILLGTSVLDASAWGSKKKSKKQSGKTQDVSVLKAPASPRIDPLHDERILSKFKNPNEIKARVKRIDSLDKVSLKKEFAEVHAKRELQRNKLAKLRQQELADLKSRREKLQATKALLKEQGLEPNSFNGLYNRLGFFVKETQLKQVKSEEQATQAKVDELTESLRLTELLDNYLGTKVVD